MAEEEQEEEEEEEDQVVKPAMAAVKQELQACTQQERMGGCSQPSQPLG